MMDAERAKGLAETWGQQLADKLIAHSSWPACDQAVAVAQGRAIVEVTIGIICSILGTGEIFAPFIPMMEQVMMQSFQQSFAISDRPSSTAQTKG